MIYLGYQDPPTDDRGSDYGPGVRPPRNAPAVESQAIEILNHLQTFLMHVAQWEASYMHSPNAIGRNLRAEQLLQETVLGGSHLFSGRYINAEANALFIESEPATEQHPERYRLYCDMGQALRNRRGSEGQLYDVSWVFYRLHWLALAESFNVYIWDVNIPDGARFSGVTLPEPEGTPWRTILVDGWVRDHRNSRFIRRSQLSRGEVAVHESVIHAYRDARTLRAPVSPSDFLWGHHTSRPFHVPTIGASRHTLADIEADILTLIFQNRPPRFADVTPSQQEAHDRQVETIRSSLTAVCHGNRSVQDRQLSQAEFNVLREYCPNPAGARSRQPGPMASHPQ